MTRTPQGPVRSAALLRLIISIGIKLLSASNGSLFVNKTLLKIIILKIIP
jgi:hypothetical protein